MRPFKFFVVVAISLCCGLKQNPDFPMQAPQAQSDRDEKRYREIQILVPLEFGRLVERHMVLMRKRRYFYRLSGSDLFHGHILLKSDAKDFYDSPEELAGDIKLVVYHTDEYLIRWNLNRRFSPERRRQRSIVGYPDGSIGLALGLIDLRQRSKLPDYECCGTVHDTDIARARRDFYLATFAVVSVGFLGRPASLEIQFLIIPKTTGRFSVDGKRYEVCFVFLEGR